MKLVLVLALLVPAVADAGHCHEVSHVVGYERCSRFGAWSRTPSLWIEGGPTMLRFQTADAQSIVATGGQFRDLIGFRGGYFGSEVDIATFSDGSQLAAVPRGGTGTMSSGDVFEGKLVLGYRQLLGPLSLALEASPGFRGVTFNTMSPPAAFDMAGLLEIHARADVWVSPHWTVGAQVSTDILRVHDDSVALTLGVHLTPWDGLR